MSRGRSVIEDTAMVLGNCSLTRLWNANADSLTYRTRQKIALDLEGYSG